MGNIFIAGLGGFLGAILRYVIGSWVRQLSGNHPFPYGTLTVNVLGCLAIGLATQLFEIKQVFSQETRIFLLVGLLGAFTTFSTFGIETLNLFQEGKTGLSIMNILIHLLLGLFAVWLGHRTGHWIWK